MAVIMEEVLLHVETYPAVASHDAANVTNATVSLVGGVLFKKFICTVCNEIHGENFLVR